MVSPPSPAGVRWLLPLGPLMGVSWGSRMEVIMVLLFAAVVFVMRTWAPLLVVILLAVPLITVVMMAWATMGPSNNHRLQNVDRLSVVRIVMDDNGSFRGWFHRSRRNRASPSSTAAAMASSSATAMVSSSAAMAAFVMIIALDNNDDLLLLLRSGTRSVRELVKDLPGNGYSIFIHFIDVVIDPSPRLSFYTGH